MGSYLLKNNKFDTFAHNEVEVSDFKIPEVESSNVMQIVDEEIRTLEKKIEEEQRPKLIASQEMEVADILPEHDYQLQDEVHTTTPTNQHNNVELKQLLTSHLLNILNNGTFEDLTALQGIGKVRAMKIFTKRNSGIVFESLEDLEHIDMNSKNIQRFATQNLGSMFGK